MSGFPQTGPVFPARFPGACPECGCDFDVGENVRYVQAHDGEGPVHEECTVGSSGYTRKPNRSNTFQPALDERCPECGLHHRGKCDW